MDLAIKCVVLKLTSFDSFSPVDDEEKEADIKEYILYGSNYTEII